MESKKLVERMDRTRVDRLEKGLPKGEWWASQGKTPWGDTPHRLKKGKGKKGKRKEAVTRFITVPGTALSVGDIVDARSFFPWTSGNSKVVKVQPRSDKGHVDATIEDGGDKYYLMFHPGTTVLKQAT